MKTPLFTLTLLTLSLPALAATQNGYCTYESAGKRHVLSYFSNAGLTDYFTDQNLTIQVTEGSIREGRFKGIAQKSDFKSCTLVTYVEPIGRIEAQSYQAKIHREDHCGRFVFNIPVTENALCVFGFGAKAD